MQALQGQLDAGVDPLTAIKTCDLYSDPQQVWVDSKPYIEAKRNALTSEKRVSSVDNDHGQSLHNDEKNNLLRGN